MDEIYDLPYMRTWHPMYDAAGRVPALSEVRFSLISCRGCFGGCSFCALTFHQGRIVQVRSHESLVREAEEMLKAPEFESGSQGLSCPAAKAARRSRGEEGIYSFRYPV